MVKDVTLAFFSIQSYFIRRIRANFSIPNSRLSLDTGQKSHKCVSDFRVSGQSFIKENGHNSRISHDIDMKLGPITKIDKRNTGTSKN